jgi:hypothetical protein
MHKLDWMDELLPIVIGIILTITLFCAQAPVARAGEIPREKAIPCLLGEAEAEGYTGLLALAHALRNRGSTKGVYGCNAPRVKSRAYSSRTLVLAIKAWEESRLGYDITEGADHWQSKEDMKRPAPWRDKCELTVIIKNHTFFNCK